MQHSNNHADDSTAANPVIALVTDALSAKLLGKISPKQKRLCIGVYSTDSLPHLFNYTATLQQRELIMKPSYRVQKTKKKNNVDTFPNMLALMKKRKYISRSKSIRDFHKLPFIERPPLQ